MIIIETRYNPLHPSGSFCFFLNSSSNNGQKLKENVDVAKEDNMKGKKETIGVIKGIDLVRKSAPKAEISFRTGRYNTVEDRPRDKSYKRTRWDD